MSNEKCINGVCVKGFKKNIYKLQIIPLNGNGTKLEKIFSYFLYSAPNIDSINSKKIPIEKHNEVFERMMNERHFVYKKFCSSNTNIEKVFSEAYLNGTNLCLKCKRFVCKKKKTRTNELSETDLDCFLRHIRNSIAHGRVYCNHIGNKIYIVFEDENKNKNLSSRIVCIKADLECWKSILMSPIYYKN